MATAEFKKYEDMDKRKIVNSLIFAERRDAKYQTKIDENRRLISFLRQKLTEALNNPKGDFQTYEDSGLAELTAKVEKNYTPQELEKIDQKIDEEMQRAYDD